MEFIALFLPAIVTVSIRYKRNNGQLWTWFEYVKEYAQSVLINVILSQCVVVYVLGATGEEISDFARFAFSTKYLIIACALAFAVPYIWEALAKAVAISVNISTDENDDAGIN